MAIEGEIASSRRVSRLPAGRRPRLAVFKGASCDGCQLQVLSLEDDLLELAGMIDIAYFAEASSTLDDVEPFDLTLVEGSVSTPEQAALVHEIRARSRFLVTIGACATAGGIQALRNFRDHREYLRVVYAAPEYVDTLATSTPIAEHVRVDFELRGCPIDKQQLRDVITSFLVGRKPAVRDEAVCMECKRKNNVCVMVARNEPCLGPVTQAGCYALCPTYDRGCYGCFGPRESANTQSIARWMGKEQLVSEEELLRRFRHINGWNAAFREESERHER